VAEEAAFVETTLIVVDPPDRDLGGWELEEAAMGRETDPPDLEIYRHVEPIFLDAAFVRDLGIRLTAAGLGWCETALTVADHHLQQHGFVHAGVITTLADHTAGGAARAAVPPGNDVLTIELKINFLRPVKERRLLAVGRTLRAGKKIVVSESEVFAGDDGTRLVAKCISTLIVTPQGERLAQDAGDGRSRRDATGKPVVR
jgi:uncharacterized protein (TIGR00369 family)